LTRLEEQSNFTFLDLHAGIRDVHRRNESSLVRMSDLVESFLGLRDVAFLQPLAESIRKRIEILVGAFSCLVFCIAVVGVRVDLVGVDCDREFWNAKKSGDFGL
jgi:hypothetical protein